MSTPVLSIQNLAKKYGNIQALGGISYDIPQGCVYGILGPNGSGKTTTLGIILNVLNPTSGTFKWFGKEGSSETRKNIGSLLETPNFYHYLSAVDNLKITQAISGRGTPEDIDKVLESVNLAQRKNSKFKTYSLGMKQRLAIAAALLGNPDVLVFDEPTNGLDPVGIVEIRELIKSLAKQGKTIIIASHLLDEIEKVCTHVAIMKKGTLITAGAVDEVLVNEDVIEVNAANVSQLYSTLQGFSGYTKIKQDNNKVQLYFPTGTSKMEDINRYCFEKGIVLSQLGLKRKSLEAIFFELTNN